MAAIMSSQRITTKSCKINVTKRSTVCAGRIPTFRGLQQSSSMVHASLRIANSRSRQSRQSVVVYAGDSVVELKTEEEFEAFIAASHPTMVDFSATWCGPCKIVAPLYAGMAEEVSKTSPMRFAKMNIDQVPTGGALAKKLGVKSLPMFTVFEAGEKKDSVIGSKIDNVKKLVNTYAVAA